MSEKSVFQSPAKTASAADDIVVVAMTAEMVRKSADIHVDALAGSRTAIMGEAYCRAFIDWFRVEHGGIALVAIDRHRDVVGYVIGAPLGYSKALSRHLAWIAARAFILRPWLIFRQQFRDGVLDRLRLLIAGRSTPSGAQPEIPAPTMSLVAIGVLPAARGRKIGLRLVQSFENKAGELQIRSLRLSTRSDNAAACRLYERCGWQPSPLSNEMTYYFRILPKSTEE